MKLLYEAKCLGYRELNNGAHLIGHVPHVAPKAWLHTVYSPLSEAHILELENNIRISFPYSFISLSKLSNGLRIFSDTLSIDGYRLSYNRVGDEAIQPYSILTQDLDERPKDSRVSFLYIGGYFTNDGSSLYIDNDTDMVYRCTHKSSQPLNQWNNLWDMLLSKTIRLSKLFDSNGKQINPKQPLIPEREVWD